MMKKIDKAVKIFLKRENMEHKAEIPGYIKGLKETIVDVYCPSAFDLPETTKFCRTGTVKGCQECWNEEVTN